MRLVPYHLRVLVLGGAAPILGVLLPILLGSRVFPAFSELPLLLAISGVLAIVGAMLSVPAAAVFHGVTSTTRLPLHVSSCSIGMLVGAVGALAIDLAIDASHPITRDWVPVALGAGGGTVWGILAPRALLVRHGAFYEGESVKPSSSGEAGGD